MCPQHLGLVLPFIDPEIVADCCLFSTTLDPDLRPIAESKTVRLAAILLQLWTPRLMVFAAFLLSSPEIEARLCCHLLLMSAREARLCCQFTSSRNLIAAISLSKQLIVA